MLVLKARVQPISFQITYPIFKTTRQYGTKSQILSLNIFLTTVCILPFQL